jgi:hypothetical protein
MEHKTVTTFSGMKHADAWLAYWDADKGLTTDGRTMREFIKMIQADAYSAGNASGYAEGAGVP